MVKEKNRRDQFIESNLGLVHSICRRFIGRGIEYDDLYQAGCIGLIKATDAFDEERGVCFSTYAVPVIMGEVRRMFRDGGTVKVSRNLKELAMKINKEKQVLLQKFDREPTVNELAEALGETAENITEAICASQPVASLTRQDDCLKENELPTISCEDEISDRIFLEEAIKRLDSKEQKILNYRYFNQLTQSKTAEKLKMTQVQVSRAEKKILEKLRGIVS